MSGKAKMDLRSLLTDSYSRINYLNGLFKKKDMEDNLKENSQKCKMKAKNLINSLHYLLDISFAQLLQTIDSTVADISHTLNEHSVEIEESVAYMAQICLIAESFMKNESSNLEDGVEIKRKLIESLEDSTVLKTIDYHACVSMDLDVDLKSLFAVPFIHIISHKGDQSGTRNLCSLGFEDLKTKNYNSAANLESDRNGPLTMSDHKQNSLYGLKGASHRSLPSQLPQLDQKGAMPNIPGLRGQVETHSTLPPGLKLKSQENLVTITGQRPELNLTEEMLRTDIFLSSEMSEKHSKKLEQPYENVKMNVPTANLGETLQKDLYGKMKQNLAQHCLDGTHRENCESGYESLSHSSREAQESPSIEQLSLNVPLQQNAGLSAAPKYSESASEKSVRSIYQDNTDFVASQKPLRGDVDQKLFYMACNDSQISAFGAKKNVNMIPPQPSLEHVKIKMEPFSLNALPDRQT